MTPESDEGFILRVHALTETSLVVRWLTADHGRLATVARGARQARSPFHGRLDLFFSARISFQRSRRSDLHTLREVSVTTTHPGVRADYPRLAQASYAVALVERVSEPETPVPELHRLLGEFLAHLDARPALARNVHALEVRMLAAGGLDPVELARDADDGVRRLMHALRDLDWADLGGLEAAPPAIRVVNRCLQAQIESSWGRIPRGRDDALRRPGSAPPGP
ncbi:MAG: DNA repair protein RecO [Verrucomicrobiae bacterium]|nr:DNA repair protein RecO [Verrucomicrobiae bacterium]